MNSNLPSTLELVPGDVPAIATAHRDRVDALLAAHPHRTGSGSVHPVWGFMFTYYSFRVSQLRRWHPGYGVEIPFPFANRYLASPGYTETSRGATAAASHLDRRRDTVVYIDRLLRQTATRPPRLNCFGLHEWAMVYQQPADENRHSGVPLRLSSTDTAAVVDSLGLRCTHFDAYRFFTPAAAPRNSLPLTRATQLDTEQPGCIHAGMDLYKWAYKLVPLIDSTLVVEALELAFAFRELDMRASPYDLADYDFTAIPIETTAGRAEYARRQSELVAQAEAVRGRIIAACQRLLG